MTRNLQPNRPEVQTKLTSSRRRIRAAALTSLALSAILGVATADSAFARMTRPPGAPQSYEYDTATTRSTAVSVSCSPNPVVYPNAAQCTAVVGSDYTTPSGKVSWTTSGNGYFPSTACELATGRCTVSYRPAAGDVNANITIQATYLGNANHYGSSASALLAVRS